MDITNFISNGITYPIGDTKSRESIAAAFDSTASYSEGDYVMYDGTLYKFTSSHSGNWDSTHVEATCVTDELGSGGGSGGNAKVMYFYEQTVNTATNAEIFRITNGKINTDTVVLECTFADPSYITSDVTWTSYEGYIAFTGTCTTATTVNVTMAYKTENSVSDRLMTLLWENPSPNSSFAAQIISLDLSQYEMIAIESANDVNASNDYRTYQITQSLTNGKRYKLFSSNTARVSGAHQIFTRDYIPTTTGIVFGSGCSKSTTATQVSTTDENILVPQAIYGISKYNYFEEKNYIDSYSKYSDTASKSHVYDCTNLKSGIYLIYIATYATNAATALYALAVWDSGIGLSPIVNATSNSFNYSISGKTLTLTSTKNYWESHIFMPIGEVENL